MTATEGAPEIGQAYEVVIGEEIDNQWTGPLGIGTIGGVRVVVPKARRGERLTVRVTGVALDPWTKRPEARFEIVTGASDEPAWPLEDTHR